MTDTDALIARLRREARIHGDELADEAADALAAQQPEARRRFERDWIARAEAAEAALAQAREALRWIAKDAGEQGCGLNECQEIARAALTGEAT